MAEVANKKQFQELEYVFDRYYREHIAPVVKGQMDYLQKQKDKEYALMADRQPAVPSMGLSGGGMMTAFMRHQEIVSSGVWNQKTSDDLLNMIDAKLGKDRKLTEDLAVLTNSWKVVAIQELGEDGYKQLSEQCPSKDLAEEFVRNRFQQLQLEQLASAKVPKSSLEYIMSKGFGSSLPGLFGSIGQSKGASDEVIEHLAEKLYGPSFGEKAASHALNFAIDTASTGGYGTLSKVGLTLEGVGRGIALFGSSDSTFDENLGELLYEDKKAFTAMRSEGRKTKASQSEAIHTLNGFLNKPMTIPIYRGSFNQASVRQITKDFRSAAKDGIAHLDNVNKVLKSFGLKPDTKTAVPSWMMEKDILDNIRYSSRFLAIALEMKNSGRKEMDLNGKKLSFDEVLQRGYDYTRAAAAQQEEINSTIAAQKEQIKANNVLLQANDTEIERLKAQQAYLRQQHQLRDHQQQLLQQQAMRSAATSSWGGLMDTLGLSGMGDIGHNFGYVLSMLPDMLVGMFTGETKSLKLKDNMFPIAAIFAGMFVKNPILKMLLVCLGGANLLNKAGHEAMEKDGTVQRSVLFREYPNEVLDSRIVNPAMKGRSLLCYIDGVPNTILIDDATAAAYEKGKLPLNTLCNAVLRKYDEQYAAVSSDLNRQLDEGEERSLGRGLK